MMTNVFCYNYEFIENYPTMYNEMKIIVISWNDWMAKPFSIFLRRMSSVLWTSKFQSEASCQYEFKWNTWSFSLMHCLSSVKRDHYLIRLCLKWHFCAWIDSIWKVFTSIESQSFQLNVLLSLRMRFREIQYSRAMTN